MLAQCPWCGGRFEAGRAGRRTCPLCGAEIEIPETAVKSERKPSEARDEPPGVGPWEQTSTHPEGLWVAEEEPAGPSDVHEPGLELAPWERRGELGIFRAFGQTWVGASLYPQRFFQRLAPYPHVGPAYLFALLVSLAGFVVSWLWAETVGEFLPGCGQFVPLPEEPSDVSPVVRWLFALSLTVGGIWGFAALLHVACRIVGSTTHAFSRTFRTAAYASAPGLVGILPGTGFIAFIWECAVLVVALRWTHGLTTGRALAALVLAFVGGVPFMLLVMTPFALLGAIAGGGSG